jgi:ribonuclease BN (tRNA processing enzyme)
VISKGAQVPLRITVIGDSPVFSPLGKGTCYLVSAGAGRAMIDAGCHAFDRLGMEGVDSFQALVATHSHHDHCRWFTDYLLYRKYHSQDSAGRVRLAATEDVLDEFRRTNAAALERTLSLDGRRIVNVPFEDYVDPVRLGPPARFRIRQVPDGNGGSIWRVWNVDAEKPAAPDRAKVCIHPKTNWPRMLFHDPRAHAWVEPETFYDFGDPRFYFQGSTPFALKDGLQITAVKAASWHGPPTTGLAVEQGGERAFLSSDTVYDPELWKALASERRKARRSLADPALAGLPVVDGDINDYIERTWSDERLAAALAAFNAPKSVLFHDCDYSGSVVHTTYDKLIAGPHGKRGRNELLIVHTPEEFVSAWPIVRSGQTWEIDGGRAHELIDGKRVSVTAQFYARSGEKFFAGYEDPHGESLVCRDAELGGLAISPAASGPGARQPVARVRFLRDIGGRYVDPGEPIGSIPSDDRRGFMRQVEGPVLRLRTDGRVERLDSDAAGSKGTVLEDKRERAKKK